MRIDDDPPAPLGSSAPGSGGLVDLLDLAVVGPELFRAAPRSAVPEHAFGGAVVAQALHAAGRTVPPERAVHSLHGHFLRPGDVTAPTDLAVTPVRDGGSYTTRSVAAEQHSRAVFTLTASFQVAEEGWQHQGPALDAPAPEDLPTLAEMTDSTDGPARDYLHWLAARHAFDLRFVGELPRLTAVRGERAAPHQQIWLRSRASLPDDPLTHSCGLAYASDMLLLGNALAPHGTTIGAPDVAAASLDHAVWFHEPARIDEWLLYDQESTWAGGGRTLCRGRLFDRAGRLVATVAQEGMIRRRFR